MFRSESIYHWQPEYSRCHDSLWIHCVIHDPHFLKSPLPSLYHGMTGICGLIWLSKGNFSVSPCIRLEWSKQYRTLSWSTYGTCHLTALVIFSIFDDHVDSAKCCAMESWLSLFPNHSNFKPGRPVFPVDLMVPNPKLDSSVDPKSWMIFNKLNATGFRNMLMNEMQTRSMWEWRSFCAI